MCVFVCVCVRVCVCAIDGPPPIKIDPAELSHEPALTSSQPRKAPPTTENGKRMEFNPLTPSPLALLQQASPSPFSAIPARSHAQPIPALKFLRTGSTIPEDDPRLTPSKSAPTALTIPLARGSTDGRPKKPRQRTLGRRKLVNFHKCEQIADLILDVLIAQQNQTTYST